MRITANLSPSVSIDPETLFEPIEDLLNKFRIKVEDWGVGDRETDWMAFDVDIECELDDLMRYLKNAGDDDPEYFVEYILPSITDVPKSAAIKSFEKIIGKKIR